MSHQRVTERTSEYERRLGFPIARLCVFWEKDRCGIAGTDYSKTQRSGYVFTRGDKNPVLDFRRTWTKITEAVGLNGLLVHDLRRSAVKRMLQHGIPQTTAMRISGHRTEAVFRRYAIVSQEDLKDAARRLESRPVVVAVPEKKRETMETAETVWRQSAQVPQTTLAN